MAGYFYGCIHHRAHLKPDGAVFILYRVGYVNSVCIYGIIFLLPDAYGRKVYAIKHLRAILVG
jgi:hypothetical protein